MKESHKYGLYVGLLLSFSVYTMFVYTQPVVVDAQISADPAVGKMIWQERNCSACHQLYGLGGFLGPDLTNVYSATGKGSLYIKAFVSSGTTVMPSFDMSEKELEHLLAFLAHVDASGKADPKTFKRNVSGTIEPQ
ncbi:MAG: cytochrome c [Cyclobacteriaceae bacterium]|nr:MAG: cytochrome c [Cyclobacteriaceae bacterium]